MSEERHPATAKLWEWFENDPRALRYSVSLRAAIRAKIRALDADLIAWDRVRA